MDINTIAKTKSLDNKAIQKIGLEARSHMTEQEKELEGSRADKVEFICAILNPAVKQMRNAKGKQKVPCNAIIGYKFRVLEDTTYLRTDYRPNAKDWDDVELKGKTVEVKAGDVIQLNIIETIRFLTKNEYGGFATGGDKTVFLSAIKLKASPRPRVVLRIKGGGSLKANGELFATGTAKNWVCKDEYKEHFGMLISEKNKSLQPNSYNPMNTAAALRQLFANQSLDEDSLV